MTEGNRLDVFFIHPNRGKRMVYGSKSHEKLGYIGYGSFISNVHESDVAARPSEFICGVCQKPFTVIRETAYCQVDFPPTVKPQPSLGQLKPRSAQERITASEQRQQTLRHQNFQGQPVDPWQDQGYNPQAGFNQQAPPPPPQEARPLPPQQARPVPPPAQPVFNPPPPQPPPPLPQEGKIDDPSSAVAAVRQQKEQSFGIPSIEPGEIGPPPNLSQPVPEPSPAISDSITDVKLTTVNFGRSVNSKHKKILADNGINTLYDAMKLGNTGLENINGIGAGVSSAIMIEVDHRLAT